MPLAYLLSESPKTQLNILTGMQEMIFEVLMWSLEAREAVYRHLKEDPDKAGMEKHLGYIGTIRLVYKPQNQY